MEAHQIEIAETVPASRKLGADKARELAAQSTRVIVAKGKKVSDHAVADGFDDEVIEKMLGPTGNLRAPTACVGDTVLVGFNEETYAALLLGEG